MAIFQVYLICIWLPFKRLGADFSDFFYPWSPANSVIAVQDAGCRAETSTSFTIWNNEVHFISQDGSTTIHQVCINSEAGHCVTSVMNLVGGTDNLELVFFARVIV